MPIIKITKVALLLAEAACHILAREIKVPTRR